MNNQLVEFNKSLTTIKHEHDLPSHITIVQYRTLRNHPDITNMSDRMLVTLMWETGGRISDILSFRWKNLEGLNTESPIIRFVIQKTNKPITIPVSLELAQELRTWKQFVIPKSDDDYLFPGLYKGHVSRQNVHKKMKKWGLLVNLPGLHAHMFRHGLIVYLFLVQGLHYKIVAARTGHSNPLMILNTYSVVTTEMQRDALKSIPMR